MKLSELLQIHLSESEINNANFVLEGARLQSLLPYIAECTEFKGCELQIVHERYLSMEGNVTIPITTTRFVDGLRQRKNCYLYSITFTPRMYDPSTFAPVNGIILRGLFDSDRKLECSNFATNTVSVTEQWNEKWSFKL